mmetsp:Transcript_8989/g.20402  ORF Transcript_8989/g.20402 Transcript_8989/m.20402 type:complete len:417 (+) Transcript_8989:329-1579(+)
MDLLRKEIQRKKRAASAADAPSKRGGRDAKSKKYMTARQLRELEEEEEERDAQRRTEQKRRKKKRKKRSRDDSSDEDEREAEDLTTLLTKKYDPKQRRLDAAAASSHSKGNVPGSGNNKDDNDAVEAPSENNGAEKGSSILESIQKLSPDDVTKTLRRLGLPIRLFGELTNKSEDGSVDDGARLRRLSTAVKGREAAMLKDTEADEFLLDSALRTRNVFLEKDVEQNNHDDGGGGDGGDERKRREKETSELTEEQLNDKPKRIYRYFKSLIRQWEEDLALRPEAVKKSMAGRNETKTLKQCKDYIRPLFQLCKRRELEEDLQLHLFNIVTYCEQGEFVKANDSYMDVAIGRAAWPIGVTMVGIHARSGRARIESSNVAHVMNSELHRKYLTSVKRLMRYAQNKRPDVNPSKKVRNL